MKRLYFNPFGKASGIDASESEFFTDPVYIANVDNSRQVKATLTTSGSYFGGSLAVKAVECATEGGSYTDVSGGGFTAQTAAGDAIKEFTLGANVHIGTQLPNYGKWLKFSLVMTGGDSGGTTNVAAVIKLDNVFVPDDVVEIGIAATTANA